MTRVSNLLMSVILIIMGVRALPAEAEKTEAPMSIQDCISIALERNLAIRNTEEDIRASIDRRWQTGAEMLPKFSAQYTYNKFNDDRLLVFGSESNSTDKSTELDGAITQPIFTGGALLYSYQIAKDEIEAAHVSKEIVRQDLILLVYDAYFNILKTRKLMEVTEQAVKALEGHRDVAKEFYNVGMIPKNDYLKSEVELANAVQDLTHAQNNVALAESRLNTILRRPLHTLVNLKDRLDYKPITYDFDEAMEIGLKDRPELDGADLAVSISNKGVQLAKSEYFPQISLIYNYAKTGEDVQADDDESWTVTAIAKWTFFEWGRVWKKVDEAESVLNKANNNKQNLIEEIMLQIKQAYLQLKDAEKNISVAKKSIEQAEEGFRMSEERYKEQVATSIEVLDAQTLLTQARTNYYNALSDYNLAKASLERAMGRIR